MMLLKLLHIPLLFAFTTTTHSKIIPLRPANTTICDYYTTTILGSLTPSNSKLLLTLLINTVILGNYTTPNTGIAVHGIAAPGEYEGTPVALLPYFTPALLSTNHGGDAGVGYTFLDDGAATALAKNMSSNGNPISAQTLLLNHIYQYFASLLNCSMQGTSDEFPAYQGRTSMYEVHKFMYLSTAEVQFFTQQLLLSASSLGFSDPDVAIFNATLQPFYSRCSPATSVARISGGSGLQNVCLAPDCPLHEGTMDSACAQEGYAKAFKPGNGTIATNDTGSGTGNSTNNGTLVSGSSMLVEKGVSMGVMVGVGALGYLGIYMLF